jgi:hypothetical protein
MGAKQKPSFETVWAALQETDRMIKESRKEFEQEKKEAVRRQKETDRQIKESARRQKEMARQMRESRKEFEQQKKETDQEMKESRKRFEQEMKEYNRRFGEFTNRFGEVVEYMIAPNLCEKFRELGYNFPKANSGTRVNDHYNKIHFEIDVMLENGDMALLVEVKTKLTTEHVKKHIERLDKMRIYADLHDDKRSFIGAAAGVVMTPYVKDYALKQGFFVIEPSGETFNITKPYNKPKQW